MDNKTIADANRWRKLMALAGHLQDGSQETIKLVQDDATMSVYIYVGNKFHYEPESRSFEPVIDNIAWPDDPIYKPVEDSDEEFYSIPEHNLSMIEAQLSLFRGAVIKDIKDSQLEDLLIMIVTHLQGREIQ